MKTNWTKHWSSINSLSWNMWVWRINRAYKKLLKNISLNDVEIIELGSGSGVNSLNIAKILKAKKITLVDFNKKALDISKKIFKDSDLDVNYLKKMFLI